jgi:hypothetical protein
VSAAWVALVDGGLWAEEPGGNPFASLRSLHRDLLRLHRRGDEPPAEQRMDAIRRALDARVRRLLTRFEQGFVISGSGRWPIGDWPGAGLSDVPDELAETAALGVAEPERCVAWLDWLAAALPSQPAARLAQAVDGGSFWVVAGVDALRGTGAVSGPSNSLIRPAQLIPSAPPLRLSVADGTGRPSVPPLFEAARAAAAAGLPLSLGAASDAEVVRTLWTVARRAAEAGTLLLRFADGSVAAWEVPASSPGGTGALADAVEVNAGLMSLRHALLDQTCAFHWFRNEVLSGCSRLADAYTAARVEARRTLVDLERARNGRPLRVRVHLTGFHPAVAALVATMEEVADPEGPIQVTPVFFGGPQGPEISWRVVPR